MKRKNTSIQQLIFEGLIGKNGEVKQVPKIEAKNTNQLHLYIDKYIKLLLGTKFPKIHTPQKEIGAVLEVISNCALLGIAGGFALSVLLFLFPFPESMELVWIIKHNLIVSIVVLFLGSGAGLYIIYDFIELLKKREEKKV